VAARRDSAKLQHSVALVDLPPQGVTLYKKRGLNVTRRLVVGSPPKEYAKGGSAKASATARASTSHPSFSSPRVN